MYVCLYVCMCLCMCHSKYIAARGHVFLPYGIAISSSGLIACAFTNSQVNSFSWCFSFLLSIFFFLWDKCFLCGFGFMVCLNLLPEWWNYRAVLPSLRELVFNLFFSCRYWIAQNREDNLSILFRHYSEARKSTVLPEKYFVTLYQVKRIASTK